MAAANVKINQILLRRGNTAAASTYTGPAGEVIVDTGLNTLRVQNGVTAGGTILATNAQIWSLSNSISTITGIDTSLFANAASQQANINAITANLGAFETYANATFGTSNYSNTNVSAYLSSQSITSANIGAFQTYANATFATQSNAATQSVEISDLRSNITAANATISALTANAAIQAGILDTLTGNAATQSTVLDTLTANAATQASTLTTLLSNAVAQQTSLIDLVSNAATQAQAIANVAGTYGNANVATYLGAFDGNILPAANVTYTLGNETYQWRELWVSNNTIYLGGTPLRVDGGTLLINNAPISATTGNLVNGSYVVGVDSFGTLQWNGGAGIQQQIDEDFTIRVQDAEDDGWSLYNTVDDGSGNNLGTTQLQRDSFSIYFAGGTQAQYSFSENGTVNLPGNISWYTYTDQNLFAVVDNNGAGSIELKTQSYSTDTLGTNIRAAWTQASISTSNAQYNWVFDNYGNMIFPTTANAYYRLGETEGGIEFSSEYNFYIASGAAPGQGGAHVWYFQDSGNLIVPGNINYANGVNILSGISSGVTGNITVNYSEIQFVANSSGDGYGLDTMRLIPYNQGYDSAHIVLDPTYPNHIHIRAGGEIDNSPAELYLGGENSHFKVDSGANPNVSIRANDNDWYFGTDGNLTIGKTTAYGGIYRGIAWDWGLGQAALGLGAGEGSNSYIRQTENGLEIHPNEPGPMGDGDLRITTGNISGGTAYTWIFNGYGNMTFPSGGNVVFDSSAVSIIDGISGMVFADASEQVTAWTGNINTPSGYINFTASPAPGGSGITFADATTQTTAFSNTAVATYLANYDGVINFTASPAIISGLGNIDSAQVWAGNVSSVNGFFWSNGAAYSTGGGSYGNTEVAAYLPTYTGQIKGSLLSLISGDQQNIYAQPQIAFGYNNTTNYAHWIHTRHNAGSGVNNAIDFYTSDGTQEGTFSANAVLGLTISNGGLYLAPGGNIFWSNGNPYSTGGAGSYGNTEVAAYLPTYTGNISAGNVNVTNTVYAANIVTSGTSGNITGVNVISANTFVFAANGVNILTAAGGGSYGNTEVAAYLLTWPNIDVNILDTTSANITTLRANNFSTGNAVISGGYISALTNASIITATVTTINSTGGNITTLRATNFSTANAVITGGYVNSLTNLTATTSTITNFSTANAVISGGYISALTNASITTSVVTNFSTANAVITGGYATGLANVTATGNVTAGNLVGYGSNTSIIAGVHTSTFDNVGMVTVPNLTVSGTIDATSVTTDSLTINDTGWTNFTPTWYAGTGTNSMGDGLAEGRYRQLGKTVEVWMQITMGSTTTFGTGEYKVGLPVDSRMLGSAVLSLVMSDTGTRLYNSLAHNAYTTTGFHTSSNVTLFWDTGVVTNSSPFTWTAGDFFVIAGTYEAA